MTTKITPEAVKERIAALESAGELSLKEQFYLEALRLLVAGMDSEPVAVTDDELNAALQLHRLKVDGHSQLSDSFRAGFRYARRTTPQPAPVAPVCTCPSGDGSLRWPCPVHPGNSPVIPDSCTWHCEEDINNWHSDCGYQFQFTEDGPEENGVKFCPKCGKSVAISATE